MLVAANLRKALKSIVRARFALLLKDEDGACGVSKLSLRSLPGSMYSLFSWIPWCAAKCCGPSAGKRVGDHIDALVGELLLRSTGPSGEEMGPAIGAGH